MHDRYTTRAAADPTSQAVQRSFALLVAPDLAGNHDRRFGVLSRRIGRHPALRQIAVTATLCSSLRRDRML